MRTFIKAGLASMVMAGSLLVAPPADAVTAHCNSTEFPNKVNTSGDNATIHTGLNAGTYVCLKVGTQVTYVRVDFYGNVTNTEITNQHGNAQGISYYAWGSENPS